MTDTAMTDTMSDPGVLGFDGPGTADAALAQLRGLGMATGGFAGAGFGAPSGSIAEPVHQVIWARPTPTAPQHCFCRSGAQRQTRCCRSLRVRRQKLLPDAICGEGPRLWRE